MVGNGGTPTLLDKLYLETSFVLQKHKWHCQLYTGCMGWHHRTTDGVSQVTCTYVLNGKYLGFLQSATIASFTHSLSYVVILWYVRLSRVHSDWEATSESAENEEV